MVLQGEPLEVASLDLHPLENAHPHHTAHFELVHSEPATAVLRRGQPFSASLRFDGRGYDPERDVVRLIFSFGSNPNAMKGTRGVANVKAKAKASDKDQWCVTLTEQDAESITIEVRTPPDAPVGQWELQVKTRLRAAPAGGPGGEERSFKLDGDFYLLFNPWAKEDQVYMEDERLLEEYVLNDVGKVWVGPLGGSRGREWVFGQFDAVTLPAVMFMLERSKMKPSNRGDPVLLTRKISQMVNSNDDDGGIIEGRWDGEYGDGTAPSAWTGSVPILEQYLQTEHLVQYGQCWVFAGVITTACRALGIPCRPVSNLVSAHDANASLTIDRYYGENNEPLDYDPNNAYGDSDSIWNYHVWDEVWMARPDLPKGYGGWQAIDATPQEQSDNFYQCGPASVEAIKNGAVGFNYDVAFMLASVNADLVRWKEDSECDLGYSKIDCNKYHIGRIILTKQPWIFDPNGDKDRQDITLNYKAQEGSKAERLSLMNGVRSLERAKRFFLLPSKSTVDIEFELVELDTINIGEDFSVTININNRSGDVRNVQAVLSAESVYYTGIKAHLVKKASGDFKVQPRSKEKLRLRVRADEYLEKLVEYCNMKICAIATVTDTRYTWADEDDFQVIKPHIDIQMPRELSLDKPATAVLSFKNPLKKRLTKCKIRIEGPGLIRNMRPVIEYRDVGPLEEVKLEHRINPSREGNLKLVATFYSKELVDIIGSAVVEVIGGEE